MFTGIIETTGKISGLSTRGNYRLLTIKPFRLFEDIKLGESIAVDGCCLTVTKFDKKDFTVEASQETSRLTLVDNYKSGMIVNLERALRPGDRMGGHYVTGHVDCLGEVILIKNIGESVALKIGIPENFIDLIVEKGSIAINGISLTINDVSDKTFTVNIIPHTLTETTIDALKTGSLVNLEFDVLGKYIIQYMKKNENTGLTFDKLIESGF